MVARNEPDAFAGGPGARPHARVRLRRASWCSAPGRIPQHLANWFGPKDFTLPFCEMDFRVGGHYRLCMRSPDGKDYWVHGVYREIVEPERLVFTWERDGADDPHAGHTLVTDHAGRPRAARRASRCARRRSTRRKSATATCTAGPSASDGWPSTSKNFEPKGPEHDTDYGTRTSRPRRRAVDVRRSTRSAQPSEGRVVGRVDHQRDPHPVDGRPRHRHLVLIQRAMVEEDMAKYGYPASARHADLRSSRSSA